MSKKTPALQSAAARADRDPIGEILAALEHVRERDDVSVTEQTRRALQGWIDAEGEDLEDVHRRVSCNLALLIRYMQAEQLSDRGGTDIELEQDGWDAVEQMLLDARDALSRMDTELEKRGAV